MSNLTVNEFSPAEVCVEFAPDLCEQILTNILKDKTQTADIKAHTATGTIYYGIFQSEMMRYSRRSNDIDVFFKREEENQQKTVGEIEWDEDNDKMYLTYNSIKWDKTEYILTMPIRVAVIKSNGYYKINYDKFGINVIELIFNDAIDAFKEQYTSIYKVIALEEDANLSVYAKKIKDNINTSLLEVSYSQ